MINKLPKEITPRRSGMWLECYNSTDPNQAVHKLKPGENEYRVYKMSLFNHPQYTELIAGYWSKK